MLTKTGADGKSYPAVMPPPRAWRFEAVRLTHHFAHEQGLTERAARAALAGRGYRRSAGTVHNDLTRLMSTCRVCCPPEPEPEPGPVPAAAGPRAGAGPQPAGAWPWVGACPM